MERRGLRLLLAAGLLAASAGAAGAQGFYWYGDPGYSPYQYPYPDRDGYARFDLNCMDAARLLRRYERHATPADNV